MLAARTIAGINADLAIDEMINKYVRAEMAAEMAWDEWHLWQLIQGTMGLWPEPSLRPIALAVAR